MIQKTQYMLMRMIQFFCVLGVLVAGGVQARVIYGWSPQIPYDYIESSPQDKGVRTLSGLDIELIRKINDEVGVNLHFKKVSREQRVQKLEKGIVDIIGGVLEWETHDKKFLHSIPYRWQEDALFTSTGVTAPKKFKGADSFIEYIQQTNHTVGVIKGYNYVSEKINQFIASKPANVHFLEYGTEGEAMSALHTGEVHIVLADRLSGMTIAWKSGWASKVFTHIIGGKAPVYLLLNRKSVSPSSINRINGAIENMQATDVYEGLIAWYLYPIVLRQSLEMPWFQILQFVGILSLAVAGLRVAFVEKTTFLGSIIYAILPGFSSIIMRDLIIGVHPISVIKSPVYFLAILTLLCILFVVVRIAPKFYDFYMRYRDRITKIAIAGGVATLSVNGTMIALVTQAKPIWLWGPFFAFLTSVGGVIVQDMISVRKTKIIFGHDFVPEVPILWGFILSILLLAQTHYLDLDDVFYSVVGTSIGAVLTFILFAHYNVRPTSFIPKNRLPSQS